MAIFGYETFADMFDGGGPGAVGDKFEGGGILSDFSNFFWSPNGAEDRARQAAWNERYQPSGGGGLLTAPEPEPELAPAPQMRGPADFQYAPQLRSPDQFQYAAPPSANVSAMTQAPSMTAPQLGAAPDMQGQGAPAAQGSPSALLAQQPPSTPPQMPTQNSLSPAFIEDLMGTFPEAMINNLMETGQLLGTYKLWQNNGGRF